MAIEKMTYVNFVGNKEYLDEFINKYMTEDFGMQPEFAMSALTNVRGLYAYKGSNPCTELRRRCGDIMQGLNIKDTQVPIPAKMREWSFDEIGERLRKLEEGFAFYQNEKRTIDDEIAERRHLMAQLAQIGNIDADLSGLFDLRFFKIRFGRLPRRNYERLSLYLESLDVIMMNVSEDKEYEYLLYIMPSEFEVKVDGLFNSLQFERIRIPDNLNGTPKEISAQINDEINEKTARSVQLAGAIAAYASDHQTLLKQLCRLLEERDQVYEIRKYVAFNRESFYIVGWIPSQVLKKMQPLIDKDPNVIAIVDNDNLPSASTPPTKLKNNAIFRPFETVVTMYGLPSYDEIDPTPFIAFIYCFITGFMFGDVGQGLIFLIAGIILMRRKSPLGGVFTGGGISAVIFGFLYGSIFSYEDIIKPLFMNPIESANINTMLILGIGFGVVLLLFGMVLNIANGIKAKDAGRVLFDRNGLAGMIFYIVIIGTIVGFLLNGSLWVSAGVLAVLLLIPFLLIFFKHPLENLIHRKEHILPKEKGSFFIETIFEMVDMLLSFASNTISFVRLSAFAINHVGLSMAVLILSEMASGAGRIVVMIIGNVLIICLEGLIVGIQGLRLVYYELFSRFYSGEGRAYVPIQKAEK